MIGFKSTSIIVIVLLFCDSIFAQVNQDYNTDYIPLKSNGEIPAIYKQLLSERYKNDLEVDSNDFIENKDHLKLNYNLELRLFSGQTSFGDELTLYINNVADELLKDNLSLRNELNIFLNKSPIFNASASKKGIISVNVGLLNYLDTEAELAFILAHEISHYQEKHATKTYKFNKDFSDSKRPKKETMSENLEKRMKFTKDHEVEADSIGFYIFSKSNYKASSVRGLLEKLHYSYLPFYSKKFNQNFFNDENFILPKYLFLDSVKAISSILNKTNERSHRYDTHPDVPERLSRAETLINMNKDLTSQKEFIVESEAHFKKIKLTAHFESIQLELSFRNYGKVIYLSSILLEEFPNNKYLHFSICKALYCLAKYKNAEEYHYAADSYTSAEGEIQQVHYLFRKLSKIQLNVLAIKYIMKTKNKFKNSSFLEAIEKDLIKELVINSKKEDYSYYTHSIEESIPDSKFEQKAFFNEFKEEAYQTMYSSYLPELDKIKVFDNLSYKDRIKIKKEKEKKYKKEGRKIFLKKAILLDPQYSKIRNGKIFVFKSLRKRKAFTEDIISISAKSGISLTNLNSQNIRNSDSETFSDLMYLKFWLGESLSHGNISIIPIFSDQTDKIIEKYNTKYIMFNTMIDGEFERYSFRLLNLKTGKTMYKNFKYDFSSGTTNLFIKKDIQNIIN
jgi:Zn-dependent protease with chaperone function